jgi:hypothetical protein
MNDLPKIKIDVYINKKYDNNKRLKKYGGH